jgi:two-component system NtrC family sensor kinase
VVFWVYSITVFVLLGAVSAVPLAVLVRGLESALRNAKTLTRQLEEEIGERKRAESDLRRQMGKLRDAQAQLVQSAKLAAVGELAAGVAHELSNPLTSILGYADLVMEDTAPDNPSREDLKKVIAEARRARGVVQNLFSFSQQTKPKRESADVNEILQRTMAVVRYQLETSGIVVEEEHDAGLRPLLLDAGQMSQVFLNLISNAIRAMPEGGRLSVRTAQVGAEVAVAISDTGEGIPLQIQDRLFDPFFITGSAGTGVGLSVSLRVVEEHGGRITVESEEGRGSTFTVWLPMG